MRNAKWKQWTLAALLLALLVGVVGCVKPDPTVSDSPSDSADMLPFATATPTPTPDPNLPGEGDGSGTGESSATAPPVSSPTIRVITATPAPTSAQTAGATATKTATPRPTATPTATSSSLRNGSTGSEVKKLQQKLKDLGYYTGSVDGTFGSGTETALKEFQKTNGLTADGVAGTRTLSALYSSSAIAKVTKYATSKPTPKSYTASTPGKYRYLQLGSSGSDVTRLQNRLKELGYFNGTVNGNFGDDTEAAVIAFQQRNGCWVDGVAGEDTQLVLFSSDALPLNSGQVKSTTTTAGFQTLREGSTGEAVQSLQTRLSDLNYYNANISGTYDAVTTTAIKAFQQRNGLTVDGVAGSGTQTVLYSSAALSAPAAQSASVYMSSSSTLSLGNTGEYVYALQERLFDLGYYTGRIDGIYSDEVAAAVRAFQSANKLTSDGRATTATQAKLYAENAVASSAAADDTYTTLREGDSGERVLALQHLLQSYGYYTADINGSYDDVTVFAVQLFQTRNGLTVSGEAGPATLQLLYQGSPVVYTASASSELAMATTTYETLKQGMESLDVLQMQQYLQDLGYFSGDLTGKFDAVTFIALQAFQARNSLTADGIAGQETLTLLYSENALAAENYAGQPVVADVVERDKLQKGDEGQDVYDLQTRLQTLGYFTGVADGIFDTDTADAVKAFQAKNYLTVDGVAGQATLSALYSANVIAASDTYLQNMEAVSNRTRELEEQNISGAIQAGLAGGGVAASYNSNVYYAGGKNGSLYMKNGSTDKQLYDSPVRFLHASSKGITFVSGNKVLRIPTGGGTAQTLIQAGSIQKLSLVGDTLFYLEGSTLLKASEKTEATVLYSGIRDFTIDIYQYTAYVASESGVKCIALNGSRETLLVSTPADQVQLCDSVLFYRSGEELYRLEDGISVLLGDVYATWMAVYRDMVYYISGDRLYRCDTLGNGHQMFYDGITADVSFVSGNVYITETSGGPVVKILPVE